MRTSLAVLLSLVLAGCSEAPPEFDGKDAAAWAKELAGEGTMAAAEKRLLDAGAEAVPVLALIAGDENERARLVAIGLIARLGADGEAAVPALTRALDAKDPGTRGMAALALGRVGKKDHPALIKLDRILSRDPESRVRVAAALAVWGITGDGGTAQDVLQRELMVGPPSIARMVVEALPELGPQAVDLLIVCLAHHDPAVNLLAVEGLGQVGKDSKDARTALTEVLTQPEKPDAVRKAAARVLQSWG